jgi:hypothetical protein
LQSEPIDPYITYRLLYPGYESWKRSTSNNAALRASGKDRSSKTALSRKTASTAIHTTTQQDRKLLVHIDASLGGTYFYNNGNFNKVNLKTDEMKNGAVYPRWHPSGKFVAFLSNNDCAAVPFCTQQKVEVSDLESSMVLLRNRKRMRYWSSPCPKRKNTWIPIPNGLPTEFPFISAVPPAVGEIFNLRQRTL